MTTKKLNLVMIVVILLVFSSTVMAWSWKETWEEVKQEVKEGGEKLEASVKKGAEQLEAGVKKGIEEVENGIEDLEEKIPEWMQDLEDGLEKGGDKIGEMLRKTIDQNIDTSGQGCGTGLTTQIVIDDWGLFDFTSACQVHDKCYEQCNATRNYCDNDFLILLRKACPSKETDRVKYQICRDIAKLYWYTVSKNGQSVWKQAQSKANCR
ncbi:MAG: hypothetical protein DRR19_13060 [Candidatus Parabeggiatoa sp. nov. 1]|nr:MAG: hypothetical protein DRR19_13060 [Gammaproteobacteria bacterium]